MSKPITLSALLTSLETETRGDRITFEDFLKVLQTRGFGPLLLIPALLLILPTGSIPGIPVICGGFISVISAQMALGHTYLRLPGFISRFSIDRRKFLTAVDKIKPVTKKIDTFTHPRLEILTTPFAERVIAIITVILGLISMAVGIVPFGVTLPGLATALFALGLSGKDGFFLAGGFICIAGAIMMAFVIL